MRLILDGSVLKTPSDDRDFHFHHECITQENLDQTFPFSAIHIEVPDPRPVAAGERVRECMACGEPVGHVRDWRVPE